MKLTECLSGMEYKLTGDDVEISSLEMDSRSVSKGSLFFCLTGGKVDGHSFAGAAVKNGASALVVEHNIDGIQGVSQVLVHDSREAMSIIAANFYGRPADRLKLIAVTGTNGKTSTTYILKSIAESAGKKVGLMGTIANMIGDEVLHTELTTPDPIELQQLLKKMADAGCDWVVMEASAHAIYLRKLAGLVYDVVIFSNLTQDHLDFFGDMENYYLAKRAIFSKEHCRFAVINTDDAYGRRIAAETDVPFITYGENEAADARACNIELHPHGIEYDAVFATETDHAVFRVPGGFSVYNSLASVCAAISMGIAPYRAVDGLKFVNTIHGRCESLNTGGRGYSVILDYSHTPDSLQNILTSVRPFTKNRVIVLFGCGGDRDPIKRPIMGEIAGTYADHLIVTSDNPRTEDPMAIINAILPGVEKTGREYEVIENRREAIAHALDIAREGDVIVLAGKGHETYQDIMGVKHHFDEKEIVAELLAK